MKKLFFLPVVLCVFISCNGKSDHEIAQEKRFAELDSLNTECKVAIDKYVMATDSAYRIDKRLLSDPNAVARRFGLKLNEELLFSKIHQKEKEILLHQK